MEDSDDQDLDASGTTNIMIEFHQHGDLQLNESAFTELQQLTKTLNRQTDEVKNLLQLQVKLNHYLKAEVVRLQRQLLALQNENVAAKRKRWCCLCDEEATFMDNTNFYCSQRCQMANCSPSV